MDELMKIFGYNRVKVSSNPEFCVDCAYANQYNDGVRHCSLYRSALKKTKHHEVVKCDECLQSLIEEDFDGID